MAARKCIAGTRPARGPKSSLVHATDALGCTALINAAANDRVRMVVMLLEEGASPNARCRSGSSALSYAAKVTAPPLAKVMSNLRRVGAESPRLWSDLCRFCALKTFEAVF